MGDLDEMFLDIERSSNSKAGIFKLGKAEKSTVRFIADAKLVLKLPVHGRYIQGDATRGYTIPCPILYGHQECPFDSLEESKESNRSTKPHYCFLMWDFRDKLLKVFFFKASKSSPIPQLGEHLKNLGSISDRNFIVSRNSKEGYDIAYNVTNLDKSDFAELREAMRQASEITKGTRPNFADAVYVHKLLKTMVAQAFAPFLLEKKLLIPDKFIQEATSTPSYDTFDDLFAADNANGEKMQEVEDEYLPGEIQ
jgi:hypothetical protein